MLVQQRELEEASTTADYTLAALLERGRFEPVVGEAQVWEGVWLVSTPGHTGRHQSLVVRHADGWGVVAGQSHDTASDYAADVLAWGAGHAQPHERLLDVAPWIARLQDLDPRAVYFAHDRSVWQP